MAATILKMAEAQRPDFTERQRKFAADLIQIGLTRLTVCALVVGKSVEDLNHAEVTAGHRLINQLIKELGHGIMDARRCQTEFTQAAVRSAAGRHRLRVRIA